MSLGFDGSERININAGGADPMMAALMSSMNRGDGLGGGNGMWIVLLLLLAGGRDGFCGRGTAGAATFADQQTDFLALLNSINQTRQDVTAAVESSAQVALGNNNLQFSNLANNVNSIADRQFQSALADKDNTAEIVGTVNCTSTGINSNIVNSTNSLNNAITQGVFGLSSMFKDGIYGLSKENAQLSEKIGALACQQGVNTEKILSAIAASNCDLTNKIAMSEKDDIIRSQANEMAAMRAQMTQLICAQNNK